MGTNCLLKPLKSTLCVQNITVINNQLPDQNLITCFKTKKVVLALLSGAIKQRCENLHFHSMNTFPFWDLLFVFRIYSKVKSMAYAKLKLAIVTAWWRETASECQFNRRKDKSLIYIKKYVLKTPTEICSHKISVVKSKMLEHNKNLHQAGFRALTVSYAGSTLKLADKSRTCSSYLPRTTGGFWNFYC